MRLDLFTLTFMCGAFAGVMLNLYGNYKGIIIAFIMVGVGLFINILLTYPDLIPNRDKSQTGEVN